MFGSSASVLPSPSTLSQTTTLAVNTINGAANSGRMMAVRVF